MPPPQQQQQQQQLQTQQQQWRVDRRIGCISIAMWLGTAVRVYSALTVWENLQSVAAVLSMYLVVIAWPTYATESYMRWRVPAVSFLRVFLVALPFNFSTTVFNAIAPNVGTGGRFALVGLGFQAFLAVRIALLTFTSLGWRVPFRLHLLLQSINVGQLVVFGLHPYCNSKLLSSPELQDAAAAVHKVMGLFASVFLPNVVVSSPQGPYAQRAAFLLMSWAILGWLVPTLLLLPDAEASAAAAAGTPSSRRPRSWLLQLITLPVSKALSAVERGLSILQLPWLQSQSWQQRQRLDAVAVAAGADGDADADAEEGGQDGFLVLGMMMLLAWVVVLLTVWLGACFAVRML